MADPDGALVWVPQKTWQVVGLSMVAGAIAGLGQAPFDFSILMFVGLAAAFFLCARATTARQSFLIGLGAGTGYFMVVLHWIVEPFLVDVARHGWMAPFALVFLSVGLALFWAAAFGIAKKLSVGLWGLVPLLAGAEILRAYVLTGFPWGMPAYALVNGVVGQVAAWVGPHGLNLIVFVGAAAVVASSRRIKAIGIGILALAVWPMFPSTDRVLPTAPTVRLVQPNAPQHQKWDPDYMRVFFDRALLATRAGPTRPDLIVWPETSVPAPLNDSVNTRAAIAGAASGIPVVVGINRFEGLRVYNSAVLLDETGEAVQIYDKHHLVPFGEYMPFAGLMSRFGIHGLAAKDGGGYSAGNGAVAMDLGPLGKALPLICYEVVFPQDVTGVSERPDFLMQITNDAWFGQFSGPYQHLAQARMRAIEMGLPMVRAANTGVSAMIDAKGRITAKLALNTQGYLDAALPKSFGPTLYSRTGDWVIGLLLVLVNSLLLLRARWKTH